VSYRRRGFPTALLAAVFLLGQGCGENVDIATGPAPDFTVKLFEGGTFRLSDHKGIPVVINFFASWCRACGEETPVIEKAAREYGDGRIAFLGIAVDDTEKKAKAFMRKIGLSIPAGLDRKGEIKDAYGLYGMPTTFFIDKQGMVSYFHPGVVTAPLLQHELDKLL
jgi:cytochrome c biogenesis protein CcmG, thiol:disulfide interchange protein DsbE